MTGWRPKIVALDVDGTMVDWENRMTDTVREAVHAVKDSGIHVVISTGRAIPGVLDAARNLRLDDGIAVRDIHGVGLDELLGLAGFLKALGVHVQRGNAGAAAGPTLGREAPHATARARD